MAKAEFTLRLSSPELLNDPAIFEDCGPYSYEELEGNRLLIQLSDISVSLIPLVRNAILKLGIEIERELLNLKREEFAYRVDVEVPKEVLRMKVHRMLAKGANVSDAIAELEKIISACDWLIKHLQTTDVEGIPELRANDLSYTLGFLRAYQDHYLGRELDNYQLIHCLEHFKRSAEEIKRQQNSTIENVVNINREARK